METEGARAGNTASLGTTRCSYLQAYWGVGGVGVGSVVIEC